MKFTEIILIFLGSSILVSALNMEGSGTLDVSDDDEVYLTMPSGDKELVVEVEGSGTTATGGVTPSMQNLKCSDLYCWCTYDDGSEVPDTRVYGQVAKDCDQYGARPTHKTLLGQQHKVVTEVDEVETQEWEFEESTTTMKMPDTTKRAPQPPVVIVKQTDKPGHIDNDIKVQTTTSKFKVIDEEEEEETNFIGGDNSVFSAAVIKEGLPAAGGIIFAHPGILAAIIGGAVVGLLCAILLIMFIVYRMRKKDEGSYPLNDSKPLKNYAYAKAPSREFYA